MAAEKEAEKEAEKTAVSEAEAETAATAEKAAAAKCRPAAVPAGGNQEWTLHETDDGDEYYFNVVTGESFWKVPAGG